ncbi:HET-domain-containing protein [Didymella exigua CBS 183.55]|uniref:HET-domain-containing protein n=1 Tax=Didymella exigua CBS 183.55 TaxID=1150837 RepID=A0A6A5RHR9_9PLEO|nr:HET-domain-containing protein [Didymella exigua CBS 183.55]KAF1926644.1 HET-domain-containing protein [Didymella exigua CBS 183.55]
MSHECHAYEYPDLDTTQRQIRLLRLRHRAHNGHLAQYELHTFDLDKAPNYIALSYTWGPESPAYPIRVNRRKLQIRANLHAFLQGFTARAYIWIDQICIDQSNPEEKNHQVRMMAQIYKDCDSMIIWLGSTSHKFKEAADEFVYKPRPHSLSILLHDDYFTRLWVVQEVLLARAVRIICRGTLGFVELPWNDVHAIATGGSAWLQQHGNKKAVLALIANQGMNRYEGIRTVVARYSSYQCENPRDKVYGLLGIVRSDERLEVDYNKLVQEVFLDAARAVQVSKLGRPDRVKCQGRLQSLAREMGLANGDKGMTGLRGMLRDVFGSSKTARSSLANLPKLARPKSMGFDPQRSGACHESEASKRLLARWWCEYEGKRYYHACCSCEASKMCRCNPGKAIIRSSLAFPWVAAGVQLTAKQKEALGGGTSKSDTAKADTSESAASEVKMEDENDYSASEGDNLEQDANGI